MVNIVTTAKEMGIYTIVVDKDENSPAKKIADKSFLVSTDDMHTLVALCKQERIDGVFCGFEDFNIHTARELCSLLGIEFYATEEQIDTVTNKHKFKERCREFSVPVVEQLELEQAKRLGRFPYIVKPSDSYGSRGITVCYCEDDLVAGYKTATEISPTSSAIIENFIDTDYGVELFYTAVNGNLHLTATADRYVTRTNDTQVPLPLAEVFPSKHRNQLVFELDEKIKKMLHGMGIKNGLVLIQALRGRGGELFVYEMAYRFTGEQHYMLVKRQRGVDLAKMMIMHALGESIAAFDTEALDDVNFTRPAANFAVTLNPGKIKAIYGIDKIYEMPEVVSCDLTHKEGDVIEARGDYSRILIRVNTVAKDRQSLRRAVDEINNSLRVISTDGTDLISVRFSLE